MALVSRLPSKRVDIPNEPGEWVEIKPLTAGIALDVRKANLDPGDATIAILLATVTAWSYPAPVDEAGLRDLDSETFLWLQNQLDLATGIRDAAEKKDSDNPLSLDISPPAPVASMYPVNSGSSLK